MTKQDLISRALLFTCVYIYALSLNLANFGYLNEQWEYYGFVVVDNGITGFAYKLLLISIVTTTLPTHFNKPSSLIVVVLFTIVYVPSIIITTNLDDIKSHKYVGILASLTFVFFIASYATKSTQKVYFKIYEIPNWFIVFLMLAWSILCVFLIAKYWPIMRLVGLDEIYDQRALGANDDALSGYSQTYFSVVVSPALLAYGLVKKNYLLIFMGITGCLIMYAINAQRTIFMLPLILIALHFSYHRFSKILMSTAFLMVFCSSILLYAIIYYGTSEKAEALAIYFVFRTLAIPGLSFSQYYDLFNENGFTYWSHIKGLDQLIAAPAFFADNPWWPRLGYLIGEYVYNSSDNNANANLFSGDGAAAAGSLGVLVIGMLFTIWIALIEKLTLKLDKELTLLMLAPVAITLTNGHFFTVMLSFGGIFWTLFFYLFSKKFKYINY